MKRTTADGNLSNKFTDGNQSTGVPATVVDATWLNAIQEEIAKSIENAGLSLDGLSTGAQLSLAIQELARRAGAPSGEVFTVVNNQVTALDVTGFLFDSTKVRGARILVEIDRKTDAPTELTEIGTLLIAYRPVSGWIATLMTGLDDAGVTFSMTGAGQLQYVSTNIAGANYAGTMRLSNVTTLKTS